MPTKHKPTIFQPYWYLLAEMVWAGVGPTEGATQEWVKVWLAMASLGTKEAELLGTVMSWWMKWVPDGTLISLQLSQMDINLLPESCSSKAFPTKQITHCTLNVLLKAKRHYWSPEINEQMVMQHHSMHPQSKSESQGKSGMWVRGSKYRGSLFFHLVINHTMYTPSLTLRMQKLIDRK